MKVQLLVSTIVAAAIGFLAARFLLVSPPALDFLQGIAPSLTDCPDVYYVVDTSYDEVIARADRGLTGAGMAWEDLTAFEGTKDESRMRVYEKPGAFLERVSIVENARLSTPVRGLVTIELIIAHPPDEPSKRVPSERVTSL